MKVKLKLFIYYKIKNIYLKKNFILAFILTIFN